jgi:hypothetical protein
VTARWKRSLERLHIKYQVGQKVSWKEKIGKIVKITGRYIHVSFFEIGVHRFKHDGIFEAETVGEKLEILQ